MWESVVQSSGGVTATVVNAPTLTLNGSSVPVLFAGLTPGLVGLYQINMQVPAGLPWGRIAARCGRRALDLIRTPPALNSRSNLRPTHLPIYCLLALSP